MNIILLIICNSIGTIYVYKYVNKILKIMKALNFILILAILLGFSCRKEINNPLDKWTQDPPVAPVTKTIKTVVPVGYAASLVVSDMKGYKHSNVKATKQKDSKILYVDTELDYPYKFKNDTYGEMVIAYIQTDLNAALVSVFFTDMNITTGSFELKNVIAFPVIVDEFSDKITAVFVSMDINIGDNSLTDIILTQNEIDENLGKLENEATYITDIAIEQNAWIIEIDPGNYADMYDDEFKIFGGQQAVKVEDYETESSAGALQMAMIDVDFSSNCLKNPTSGFVFMQDVEVATSSNDNDIVFGHVFYDFHSSCDGDVEVEIATGNFVFAIGSELDLGLN